MSLGEAKDEIAKSDELWKSTNFEALRTQQETDFGLWGPYKFEMPKTEGKWDSVTTNSPKILANKIIGLLASSWLQLFIDVGEENKEGRGKISKTEQLANGCIWLADREAIAVPSGKKLQSALSAYAVLKGGTAKSLYWYEDDKKPRCAIKTYDPMFCQWEEAESELDWFCHRNYVSKAFIERHYAKIPKGFAIGDPDKVTGKYLLFTFCDDENWKVALNGEYVDTIKHGLGYIPVNIRSCGAVPYLQSVKYQDTMKWSWTSFAQNTRDIYDLESKLLSIEATKAIDSGRKDVMAEMDSGLQNEQPTDVKKLGYGSGQRNNILFFDKAKGQKFLGFAEAPGNEVADQYLTRVRQDLDIMATMDPVTVGRMDRSGSGALANVLIQAALEFINPFRECVQDDFIWLAEECVRQFKNGQFTKISVEGRDKTKQKFTADLEPEDVTEKHFDCDLVTDKLRDRIQELGAAIQQAESGMTSKRTARLQHNIVEDPDREQDIMDEEEAANDPNDPVFKYLKKAKYFKDLGTKEGDEMALYYESLSRLFVQQTIQKAVLAQLMPPVEQMGGDGKKPPVISPQAEVGRIQAEPRGLGGMGV